MYIYIHIYTCTCIHTLQFWPSPLAPMAFPESRPLLLVCCVLYFFLSFTLQLITSFYEQSWDGQDTVLYILVCVCVRVGVYVYV